MLSSLLITLREGLEAALIVAIILAYLARTGQRRGFGQVWLGVFAAVAASVMAGETIYLTAGDLQGLAEQVFEGSVVLVAASVLTWMIFWMRRQAGNMRGELQEQVNAALAGGSKVGLFLLAFVAVVREGIETVLFLFAATRTAESQLASTVGAVVGLVVAVGIGYAIYKGSSRLNLRAFFKITGLLLIVFAAGLLSHGVGEFIEAGLMQPVIEHVWDTGAIIAGDSGLGKFLTSLLGYSPAPSLVQVVVYLGYLAWILPAYLHPAKASR